MKDLRLLYETSARMGAALDVESVVTAYLRQVAAGARHACTVTQYEDRTGEPYPSPAARWRVRVLGAWMPERGLDLTPRFYPYTADNLDPPLDRGETVAIADVRSDPRVPPALRRIQEESNRPALALIPLRARGDQRFGLVVLSDARPHAWGPGDLHRYEITAALLAASLDARLQQRILHERGLCLAVFEERQRLARELHDSVTQLLFSIHLIAESLPPAWRRDPVEGERRAARLLELSAGALAEMRALLSELRPVAGLKTETPTAAEPLSEALETLARRFRGLGGLAIRVEAVSVPLANPVREALLRIVHEALANAVRHARAREVAVTLAVGEDRALCLSIVDNGVGFDLSAPRTGLGLSTMRERAEALGARFDLVSHPGDGTAVTLTFPAEGI